jgi:hypothetical protein
MRVSEKRVLRRIFGPKRKEVSRGWRRQGDQEGRAAHEQRYVFCLYFVKYPI